jgi:hypothetical protein
MTAHYVGRASGRFEPALQASFFEDHRFILQMERRSQKLRELAGPEACPTEAAANSPFRVGLVW